jgi:hypothetical protein
VVRIPEDLYDCLLALHFQLDLWDEHRGWGKNHPSSTELGDTLLTEHEKNGGKIIHRVGDTLLTEHERTEM